MARIELWNGDICDLEVDAIVNAANLSLWMSTGVGGALKRAGGDEIEFAAVRQAPVPLGDAIVTTAGSLAARAVIHAVSLDRERRTSGPVIAAAVRSAMARAREIRATSIAFPALGHRASAGSRSTRPPASPSRRCATSCLVPYHRPRDLRAARQGRVRRVRCGLGQVAARGGPTPQAMAGGPM